MAELSYFQAPEIFADDAITSDKHTVINRNFAGNIALLNSTNMPIFIFRECLDTKLWLCQQKMFGGWN